MSQTKLTEKQEMFCQLIIQGKTQSDAYRGAFSTKRMSDKTLHSKASALANRDKVRARLDRLKEERSKRLNYDADQVLKTLSDMLNADIIDIYDVDIGTFKPLEAWPPIWRQMLDGADVQELFGGEGKDRAIIGQLKKVKFISKAKLLELVGKHTQVGAYTQLHKHDVTDDLANRLQSAIKRRDEQS